MKKLVLEHGVKEVIIQELNEELVEKYGEGKYARGNGKNRHQRTGSIKRYPVTSFEKLNLKLHKVNG